jgi:hypothetical protein
LDILITPVRVFSAPARGKCHFHTFNRRITRNSPAIRAPARFMMSAE